MSNHKAKVAEIAAIYDLSIEDVMGPSKKRLATIARDHCYYELWLVLDFQPAAVAQFFNRSGVTGVTIGIARHARRVGIEMADGDLENTDD